MELGPPYPHPRID